MSLKASSIQTEMDNVCRALLSSAIHRCRATDRLCRITIAIKHPGSSENSSPTAFQISISDTGRGINLPEFLLSYSNINSHRANGIYFSSPICWDGELTIATTDMEKTEVEHFRLNWGDSRVVQVGTSSKGRSAFSGTESSFSVQGNLEEFIIYIKDLCQKIAILQIPSIALDLCVEPFDNSKTSCENIFMSKEGLLLPKSMSNIDRLAKGIVDYRISKKQKLDGQAQPPLAFRECIKIGKGSFYSLEANSKMEIVFEAVLVLKIVKDTNTSCSMESITKAKALYFEEYFPNAVTVSMVQALKSVDWKNYGLDMKGIEVDNFGDASIEWEGLEMAANLDIVLHRYKRESLKRRKKTFSELVIVKNALGMALKELKENNPELFLSQRACKMKTYAPDLSRSISGLIMSSNDMNFKEECAHIVGLSLEHLCQETLLSCINKKILDVINITDRNPTKRTANTDVQPTCEEPSKEECEDEVDNENNPDEYTSIWDFL